MTNTGHDLDQKVKLYILANVDSSGYDDIKRDTIEQKIVFLHSTFLKEMQWQVDRDGLQTTVKAWLSGLPTAVTLPFMNHVILDLAVTWGSLPANYSEKQADKIIDNYFHFMAAKTVQLFQGYHLPKTEEV